MNYKRNFKTDFIIEFIHLNANQTLDSFTTFRLKSFTLINLEIYQFLSIHDQLQLILEKFILQAVS